MNRTPALKVLIASSHADTRVAVSWMLRQSFPDAIVSKAETVAEAVQTVSNEVPSCVIGDASLTGFSAELPGLTQALREQSIPLIVIHDGDESSLFDSNGPGVAAWLTRATINVDSVDLAISQAIELADMTRRIAGLEQELQLTKIRLESAMASDRAQEPGSSVDTVKPPSPQPGSSMNQLAASSAMATRLERPGLVTSGLKISSDDERELAARVQHDLMPPGSPLIPGFDIAGLSIHAEATGGDYYDYLPMADDLLCISIGECSGRGLAPAMFMASLRAYLRVLATQTTDISDVLSQVNTLITEDIGDEEFIVTLMLVQLDDRTRTLRYASAGQQAFFLDREGNVDVLHSTGMPLGLRDETVILEGPSRQIRPGEILLLASDGVQKMTSESGEQFGTERMLNLVKKNRNLPSRIIANYLQKACKEFASPQFQHDDVTIVIVSGDDS
jgi:hypothetical protein